MSDRILVATRKGLFTFERNGGGLALAASAFAGTPVTNVVRDPHDGALYVALKHGHFGPKMHRSDDGGATWLDIATPAFPTDAAGSPTLTQIWTLETGGPHHPGRLWVGALLQVSYENCVGMMTHDRGGSAYSEAIVNVFSMSCGSDGASL